jgi:NAD(P)-dependent dehydrogenase (short-subunit alcohol dehydrogenase family)
MRLAGKIGIVTGGARGIGAAIARRYCQEGAAVLIADRLGSEGKATAAALGQIGQCEFVAADVTTEQGWDTIAAPAKRPSARRTCLSTTLA